MRFPASRWIVWTTALLAGVLTGGCIEPTSPSTVRVLGALMSLDLFLTPPRPSNPYFEVLPDGRLLVEVRTVWGCRGVVPETQVRERGDDVVVEPFERGPTCPDRLAVGTTHIVEIARPTSGSVLVRARGEAGDTVEIRFQNEDQP